MGDFKFTQTAAEMQALLNDISVQKKELQDLVDEAKQLKDDLVALRGDNNTTPEIDCQKDVDSFLEGYNDTQKLQDVVGGTIDAENEELIIG